MRSQFLKSESGVAALDACLVAMPFFLGFTMFLASGLWLTHIANTDMTAIRIASEALIQGNHPSTRGLPSQLKEYMVGSDSEEVAEVERVTAYNPEDQYLKSALNVTAGRVQVQRGESLGLIDPQNRRTMRQGKTAIYFTRYRDPKSDSFRMGKIRFSKVYFNAGLQPVVSSASVPFLNQSVNKGVQRKGGDLDDPKGGKP